MTSKIMLCRAHLMVLCAIFVLTSFSFADEKTEWPTDISSKERQHVYQKIKPTLKKMRRQKEKVSIGVFRGKLFRGDVIKVGKTKFTIVDYKGKSHTIKYKEIKASYLSKIIPSKEQDGEVLHCLGLISLHEGKKKNAKAYLDRAVKAKHSKSKEYLSSVESGLDEDQGELLAAKEEKKRRKEQALAEAKAKKERIKEEKARSKIANIASLGSGELDVKANSFPGKYTIFKFGAPW
ncbi:hypothetical protein [Candidatus Uabimicrobium sp. HlEnr_7]|uniref:hypothetical protein n=1 Tax=Candidatus Uabimicrobium helgolandensis TaxID=3095367 RepID=UPI003558935A